MTDYTTHERNRLFGPETCTIGDPCYFRLSDRESYVAGKVVGATYVKKSFDVRGADGTLYQNITDVRLDHERARAA